MERQETALFVPPPPSLLPAGQCHCTVYHLDGWMALLSAGLPQTNKITMSTFIYTRLANALLAEMFRCDYGKDLVSKFGLQLCEETREVGTVLRQGKRSWELGHILEISANYTLEIWPLCVLMNYISVI